MSRLCPTSASHIRSASEKKNKREFRSPDEVTRDSCGETILFRVHVLTCASRSASLIRGICGVMVSSDYLRGPAPRAYDLGQRSTSCWNLSAHKTKDVEWFLAQHPRKLRKCIRAHTKSAKPFRRTYTNPSRRIRVNKIGGTAYGISGAVRSHPSQFSRGNCRVRSCTGTDPIPSTSTWSDFRSCR
jgi:hypothetical protein